MTLGYIKCPKCQEVSPLYTPYPKCYYCQHTQYIEVSKVEKEIHNKVEEMVGHLFKVNPPSLQYPEVSISPLDPKSNTLIHWAIGA